MPRTIATTTVAVASHLLNWLRTIARPAGTTVAAGDLSATLAHAASTHANTAEGGHGHPDGCDVAPASNDMTKLVALHMMNAISLVRSYDSGLETDGSQYAIDSGRNEVTTAIASTNRQGLTDGRRSTGSDSRV